MVMHARNKIDGYFSEKSYQNSKYSSSSSKRDYERDTSSRSAYGRDRDSPLLNNGRNSSYRSISPECDSPQRERSHHHSSGGGGRDRYQSSSSSYSQKMRDRDYSSKKDKYSDCLRSPKRSGGSGGGGDRRSDRDTEHRTNHDRRSSKLSSSSSSEKRSNSKERDRRERGGGGGVSERGGAGGGSGSSANDRDRVVKVGDWSEHTSSSGKKYYYNCRTEVSQWEKPREWIERENRLNQPKDSRGGDRDYSSSHSKDRDRGGDYRSGDKESSRSRGGADDKDRSYSKHSNSRGSSRWPPSSTAAHDQDAPPHKRRHEDATSAADMDISPTGDSTPTSETNYSHSSTPQLNALAGGVNNNGSAVAHEGPVLLANALPRNLSQPSSAAAAAAAAAAANNHTILKLSAMNLAAINAASPQNDVNSNAPGPPTLASPGALAGLPKILSQITGNKQIEQNDLNPQKALQTINNALMRQQQLPSSSSGVLHDAGFRERLLNSPLYTSPHYSSSLSQANLRGDPVIVGANSMLVVGGDGPPTPTQELDLLEARRLDAVPTSVSSLTVGRLQTGPNLTPSLAKYMRSDLIGHVRNWPAEILEKQAQKLSEEAHLLGDLQCSTVSTELKIARSRVRITEITATLQEQKIMYFRQQIRRLEELKSQNSFMSDDL